MVGEGKGFHMTDTIAIEKLIERLQKATGPDRDLDLAIANIEAGDKPWYWVVVGQTVTRHILGRNNGYNPVVHLEPFTSDINTIVGTLMPGGAFWTVGDCEFGPFATLLVPNKSGNYIGCAQTDAYAATPALALCIAILKSKLPVTEIKVTAPAVGDGVALTSMAHPGSLVDPLPEDGSQDLDLNEASLETVEIDLPPYDNDPVDAIQ